MAGPASTSGANAAGSLGLPTSAHGDRLSNASGVLAVLAFLVAGVTAAFGVRRQLRR
jgi:hypothetical protein